MSVTGLMNQSITVKNPSTTRDKHGVLSLGSSTTISARVLRVNKVITTQQKDKEPIHLQVGIGPSDTVANGAKITYGSDDYRVMSRAEAVGGDGTVHHVELLCQLWSFA